MSWMKGIELTNFNSVYDLLSLLPILTTILACTAVFVLSKNRQVGNFMVSFIFGMCAVFFFVQYVWFNFIIGVRILAIDVLDIQREVSRVYVEPLFALLVSIVLTILAYNESKSSKDQWKDFGCSATCIQNRVDENHNENRLNVPPQIPIGQMLSCSGCGKISFQPEYQASGVSIVPPALLMENFNANSMQIVDNGTNSMQASNTWSNANSKVSFAIAPVVHTDRDQTRPKRPASNCLAK